MRLSTWEACQIRSAARAFAWGMSEARIREEIAQSEHQARYSRGTEAEEIEAEIRGLRDVLDIRAAKAYRRTTAGQ